MYARVTTFKVKPDKWDAWDEDRGVSGQLESHQGFKGIYSLERRDAGKAISITLWETEEDMKASETSGWYQEALELWEDTYAGPPVTEHYEVGGAQVM